MAKPHGFTVAAMPAASARAKGPESTSGRGECLHALGERLAAECPDEQLHLAVVVDERERGLGGDAELGSDGERVADVRSDAVTP